MGGGPGQNVAYEEAIKSVVAEKLKDEGRADVLDIGLNSL